MLPVADFKTWKLNLLRRKVPKHSKTARFGSHCTCTPRREGGGGVGGDIENKEGSDIVNKVNLRHVVGDKLQRDTRIFLKISGKCTDASYMQIKQTNMIYISSQQNMPSAWSGKSYISTTCTQIYYIHP